MALRILTQIARVIIGALFVFSGFVKLVDPMGTNFKLQEYLSEGVLNMEFLLPISMLLSMLLILAELILGIMLLIGYKPKFTVWNLFAITLIFLFLTWYSYKYNKVTDCGCFGDAITLSTKATFYKNVVFIALIGILIAGVKYIQPFFSDKTGIITTLVSIGVSFLMMFYCLQHLPVIDFRAYAEGKNLVEGMKYQGDGEVPPVHDFALESEEADLTNELLSKEKVMLIVVYNLDKADEKGFPVIKKTANKAKAKGYTVYGVSASYVDDLVLIQNKYDLPFSFLFCDETALKTAIRANPGIIILDKGTVIGKWNWTDAEDVKL